MDRAIEYVTPADSTVLAILGTIGIGVALLLFTIALILVTEKSLSRGILVAVVSAALFATGCMGFSQPLEAARQARVTMVEQTIQLYPSLTEEQVQEIWSDVPLGKPDASFEVVSTAILPSEVGDASGFTKREISLVWNGEGYVLAQSVDGEKFEPLER